VALVPRLKAEGVKNGVFASPGVIPAFAGMTPGDAKKKAADLAISGLGGIQRFRWLDALGRTSRGLQFYMGVQMGPDKGSIVARM